MKMAGVRDINVVVNLVVAFASPGETTIKLAILLLLGVQDQGAYLA